LEQVRSLPVALPSLAEQDQIVSEVERRLSVIEELEAAVQANLIRTDRLRQSVLATAFSGTLGRS
jgi:type I restriction enzyme S subunit